VPQNSPLLTKIKPDPIIQRIRSFNRSLKKAHSFRLSRERTSGPQEDGSKEPAAGTFGGREVTFKIKKTTLGRIGWKIMPDDESLNLRMNKEILDQVLDRIRTMQYSGESVPDKISVILN